MFDGCSLGNVLYIVLCGVEGCVLREIEGGVEGKVEG